MKDVKKQKNEELEEIIRHYHRILYLILACYCLAQEIDCEEIYYDLHVLALNI